MKLPDEHDERTNRGCEVAGHDPNIAHLVMVNQLPPARAVHDERLPVEDDTKHCEEEEELQETEEPVRATAWKDPDRKTARPVETT